MPSSAEWNGGGQQTSARGRLGSTRSRFVSEGLGEGAGCSALGREVELAAGAGRDTLTLSMVVSATGNSWLW
jgi:hypothetical protein